jgi:hypothetical protein
MHFVQGLVITPWPVGVAFGAAAVVRLTRSNGQLCTMAQPRNKIGVGNKQATECYGVDLALRSALDSHLQVVVVVANERSIELRAQRVHVDTFRDFSGSGGGAFDKVQVSQIEFIQLLDKVAMKAHDVAVRGSISRIGRYRRQANTYAVISPDIDNGLSDLKCDSVWSRRTGQCAG